jgi:lipoprotein NlpD
MKLHPVYMLAAVLAGCASSGHHAPVVERVEKPSKSAVEEIRRAETPAKIIPGEKDWRPDMIVVQKGDTLYSIAFNYGFDYHELAELNGIKDPGLIKIGQQIRLFPGRSTVRVAAPADSKPLEASVREQPRLAKYIYSEAALAQIAKLQEPPETLAKAETKPAPKPEVKLPEAKAPESKPPEARAPESKTPEVKPDRVVDAAADEALEWNMPTQGKLIGEFSEAANRKGIDIAGKLGQPITASAPGKVVYSGSGLRGYGKLVIIKHNKTYLSAYAHNDQVLVKEGQSVVRGQKIAEMGNSDADQVKLHFEVRRLGKPVDPAKYLPMAKS